MTAQTMDAVNWAKVGLWGPPAPRRAWGPQDVGWAAVWLVVANLAVAVPVLWWMTSSPSTTDPASVTNDPAVLTAGLVVLWAVFAGVPTYLSRRRGAGTWALDFGWSLPTGTDWAFGLRAGLVMRAADIALGVAASALGWTTGDNSSWLFADRAWVVTAWFVVGAAVIAPALEELFFRGFVMRAVARAKSLRGGARTWVPIGVSTLLFGVLHANAVSISGLYVVAVTAAAGLVLALVTVRRGNLGASIATHIVFNTTGVVVAGVMGA